MRASQCSAICLEHHLLHNCFKTKYCLLGGEEMQSFANLSERLFFVPRKYHNQAGSTHRFVTCHTSALITWISKYLRRRSLMLIVFYFVYVLLAENFHFWFQSLSEQIHWNISGSWWQWTSSRVAKAFCPKMALFAPNNSQHAFCLWWGRLMLFRMTLLIPW